ncbi:hypothetical protein [Pseudoclavibacter sp. VKM Ac-2888]|uniref:hypothetical protein n=1 Tax=Pseudoclavibacter sp. VKM Ac-2888 TaxID=2783830 RepID=UPI00188B04B8|nr:hypothetical protein [Pseudoclavibacter sp. VKM Ac-2888]MBF4549375.1 hypothetical protein [Pseudoclavibacter sp. VKM Ac-2888]
MDALLLNERKDEIRQLRAAELTRLADRTSTLDDLLERASTPEGEPLRRLRILQVLVTAGVANAAAVRAIRLAVDEVEESVDRPTSLTLAWLMDARSGERRLDALGDALNDREAPPERGFPFAAPSRVRQ